MTPSDRDQSQQDWEAFENWESQNFGTCGNVHLLKCCGVGTDSKRQRSHQRGLLGLGFRSP